MERLTVSQVRKELKTLGYKCRLQTYSDFKNLEVLDQAGRTVNRKVYNAETLEKHNALFKYLETVKGRIFDGLYRVVI